MSKFLLTLAFAAVTLVTAAVPSKAAQYVGLPAVYGTNLGVFPAAQNSQVFGNDSLAAGAFSETFTFNLTQAASVELSTASNGLPLYITGMTLELWQGAVLVSSGVQLGVAGISNLLQQGPIPLAAGLYQLIVGGTAGTPAGAVYSGTISFGFSPVNEVPLPGAVYLFGTILAGGFGGMQLMRRRRAVKAA